ncbi:glutamate--tRNA ligase [Candidatus Poribacteria bacterium]|nr:glutamate--tRNA ligase [Candidatus Poribacteria bacterium]
MPTDVRVRIAPSPTGYLHLGLARTALFNWLFAKHHKGTFILRVDDTDVERSTEESLENIIESFRWLGIEFDEGYGIGGNYGPYKQSERLDIYKEYTQKLLDSEFAYYCYCTKEELDAEREQAKAQKKPFIYSGKCRNLTPDDKKKFHEEGRKPSIRLKVNGKTIVVNDLVKGDTEFRTGLLGDFIIVRPNGMPMYNFASSVDDITMKTSHIIRADEHLSNTPKQIIIYEALKCPLPEFAHVPLVLGSKGEKLSKRHGATSAEEYRKQGYLPEAMINYLVRLGWSLDDQEEIFTIDELIENFTIDRVGKSGSVFDQQKLLWLNGEYIAKMDLDERAKAVIPFLQEAGLVGDDIPPEKFEWIKEIVKAVGDRLKTLAQIVDYAEAFFVDELEYDEKAVNKRLKKDYVPEMLEQLKDILGNADPFNEENLEKLVRYYSEETGLSGSKIIHPLRVSLTGKAVGPGIFETIYLVGRERVIERLDKAIEIAKAQ